MPLPELPYDPWFHKPHPHDSMPIATDPEKEQIDTMPSEYQPPGVDEEIEEEEEIHEKMYRIATAKYNPFAVGGSEQLGKP